MNTEPNKANNLKPSYINKNIKNVSEEHLRRVLHELHLKQMEDRRQRLLDLNEALRDGFRCVPNNII